MALGLPGWPDYSWFAVYDGHGGSFTSKYASAHALGKVMATKEWAATPHTAASLAEAMRKGFLDLDAEMHRLPPVASGDDHSGSTAIACLVTPTHVLTANVGDSRAILVRERAAVGLSEDHKPYLPAEEARIVKAGGTVAMRRVNGDLAVSRALGDFVYKHAPALPPEEQAVSPEPEVVIKERGPTDEFVVIACDGVWDVMSNDDVAAFVIKKVGAGLDDLGAVAEALLDEGLDKNSRDNMSAIIVALPGAPRPDADARAAYSARAAIAAEAAGGAAARE